MPSISQQIPSMLQGVSQQASQLRLNTHGELQENGVSHPTWGLGKRNGTDHLRTLADIASPDSVWAAVVSRDDFEKYMVLYDGFRLRVFGLDGFEYPVVTTAATLEYLRSSNPKGNLSHLTLADTTLILNRSKTVAMSASTQSAQANTAVVWVRQGNYGQKYTVKIDGVAYEYETSTSDVTDIQTSNIAAELVADINAATGTHDCTATHTAGNSWFTIDKDLGAEIDIDATDTVGGIGLSLAYKTVPSFSDLPTKIDDNLVIKVLGSSGESADDYWVVYDPERAVDVEGGPLGSWVETRAPGVAYAFDASTMPHKLTRLQDDSSGSVTGTPFSLYFTFQQVTWNDRAVGNDDPPTFVGKHLTSMFMEANRLGFLFQDSMVMSRTGDFFNFWRITQTAVSDADPIDIVLAPPKASNGGVLNLQYAVGFADEFLLIGDNAQLSVPTTEAVTPTSIRRSVAGALPYEATCKPGLWAQSAYLPFSDGTSVGVNEMYVGGDRVKVSVDLTRDVPRLIPGRPQQIAICGTENTMLVLSDTQPSRLFVYRWSMQDRQRVQSSWSFWSFGAPIKFMDIVDTTVWLLIERPEGLCMETLEIGSYVQNDDGAFPILLDRKVAFNGAQLRLRYGAIGASPTQATSTYGSGTTGNRNIQTNIPTTPGSGGITEGSLEPYTPPVEPPPPPPPPSGGDGGAMAAGDGTVSVTDSRERGTTSYSSQDDETTLTFPYEIPAGTVLVRPDTMQQIGGGSGGGGTTAGVPGDYSAVPMYAGVPFTFRYKFPEAQIQRQTLLGGMASVPTGRLQILRWAVQVRDGGPFELNVYRRSRSTVTKRFTPRWVGEFLRNEPFYQTAQVQVMGRSQDTRVEITSTSWWPAWFLNAEWVGEYTRESRLV